MAYYLGIDGGGSKTTCVIGDEINTLASATSGPSNVTRVSGARARESIQEAIRQACAAAGINPRQIKRMCIGAAGAAREEVAAVLRAFAAELVGGEIEVVGDMAIAMAAAFGGGPGIIVIAGTGSIAYGRDTNGTTARAGGWGFAISDEGSAHWTGRQAVSKLLRLADEKSDNASGINTLFRNLQSAWEFNSFDQLAQVANSSLDFAKLFPSILSAADSGDMLAQEILQNAAAELAQLASIIVNRLFPGTNYFPAAMAGGVFRHAQIVRERFCELIRARHPKVAINPEIVEPVLGALHMARQSAS